MSIHRLLAIACILLAVSAVCVADEPEYLAIFMQGKKVGHAVQTRTVADDRVTTTEHVSITISRGGAPVTIIAAETSIETSDGKPLAFEGTQHLGAMEMAVSGKVSPTGQVTVTNKGLGAERTTSLEWPEGAVMAEGLRLLTIKHGLAEGTEYEAKVFSASLMRAIETKVLVGAKRDVDLLGRQVRLTEVISTATMPAAGEVVTRSYIDDDLCTLKSTMPIVGMQVEMVSCPKEFALGENDVLEFLDSMFINPPEPLKDVYSAASITYQLKPTGRTRLVIPSTDSQQVKYLDNGNVIVAVTPIRQLGKSTFPYKGQDRQLIKATQPTRFLQSDDEKIIALAKQAVGETKDAGEAVRKIESFVAKYVTTKSLSVGYASAAEVAESRQGDCTEFAVLTAALCRAVGIPAQVEVGLAYVEDFAGFRGFGGHAWTRAHVGGKWVCLDAAFASRGGGYDAGHIALAVGDGEPADFFNMAAALGKFKIESAKVKR